MFTLIDTHSHIDAALFDPDRETLLAEAKAAGVSDALICAGDPQGFARTRDVAHEAHWHYALGLHPLYIDAVSDIDRFLEDFEATLRQALADSLFAGIGEIGLDGFVPGLDAEKMLALFRGQLKLARKYSLPVSVHARHAIDSVARELARFSPLTGVVHAFNGSPEQARRLIALHMKLGYGGALTYEGSRRIRRVFQALDEADFVLETDAPDMPCCERRIAPDNRTHPADIVYTLRCAAKLRHTTELSLSQSTAQNALRVFPRMKPEK